jgi:IstB-like ATP binding protein
MGGPQSERPEIRRDGRLGVTADPVAIPVKVVSVGPAHEDQPVHVPRAVAPSRPRIHVAAGGRGNRVVALAILASATFASAISIRACLAGQRVRFATATEWVARLSESKREGRLEDELRSLARIPLIVVDEVGYG